MDVQRDMVAPTQLFIGGHFVAASDGGMGSFYQRYPGSGEKFSRDPYLNRHDGDERADVDQAIWTR